MDKFYSLSNTLIYSLFDFCRYLATTNFASEMYFTTFLDERLAEFSWRSIIMFIYLTGITKYKYNGLSIY